MSRRRIAVVILLLATGIPIVALGGRTFRTSVPYGTEFGGDETLPIVVYDTTGLVTAIRPGSDVAFETAAVTRVDGSPGWISVTWLGGMCDARAVGVLVPVGAGGYRVTFRSDTKILGMIGCPAAAVLRAVEVKLSTDVPPEAIVVETRWN